MEFKGLKRRKSVAEMLLERKAVDEAALKQAEADAKRQGKALQEVLVEQGLMTKEALLGVLNDEWKVEAVDIAAITPDPEAVRVVPAVVLRRHLALPFAKDKTSLSVAMADPKDFFVAEDLHLRTGLEIKPFVALPQDIIAGLNAVYGEHWEAGYGGGGDSATIKYGLPDAPRKHLLILQNGSMEVCDSESSAVSRINELGRGRVKEVWEMKKRTLVAG
jgi:hypothetical protein